MNELVKWQPVDRHKIETALALSEKRIALKPVVETYDLHCICAIHDKPYILRFVRGANRLLHCAESIRLEGSGAGKSRKASMRMDQFDNSPMPCAWCGTEGFGLCSCKAFVCYGRMVGTTFHCRPSCGASWDGVPLKNVEVSKPGRPQPMQALPPMTPYGGRR